MDLSKMQFRQHGLCEVFLHSLPHRKEVVLLAPMVPLSPHLLYRMTATGQTDLFPSSTRRSWMARAILFSSLLPSTTCNI